MPQGRLWLYELPVQTGGAHACRELVIRENPDAAEQMDTEQTWPTEEELTAAVPRRRRLPPGTSDYQACWILDDEDEEGDDEDDDGVSDGQGGAAEASAPAAGGGATGSVVGGGEGMDFSSDGGSDMDVEEEEPLDLEEMQRIRAERRRRAVDDDLQFPDEMDTPHEVPARVRSMHAPLSRGSGSAALHAASRLCCARSCSAHPGAFRSTPAVAKRLPLRQGCPDAYRVPLVSTAVFFPVARVCG